MKISQAGISLIKRFAILHRTSFRDDHGWVIGFNHREHQSAERRSGKPLGPDMHVTEAQAEELFNERVSVVQTLVNSCIKVRLTQSRFDALCSYVYGMIDMRKFLTSDIVKHLNAHELDAAGIALMMSVQINRKLYEALARRRYAELKMFLHDDDNGH